ncbi:MAG: Rne/Rng family ribonuclease [Bacteroidetes bacterium]|jgi:ribonuclease G|nr:Rne/Rng family ribonuclease [Bacteroidota bacterium]
MSKEIVVNAEENQTRIAIVEDGKLAELYIENPENKRTIGNIYLGRVRKVMPSIQAAFVDIGQEQDAFLHFSDLSDNLPAILEFLKHNAPKVAKMNVEKLVDSENDPSKRLKRGQDLLVQITKEPISNKGSRITTSLTLAGRFLVLMPLASHIAVSRKITKQKERRRLQALAESLVPDGFGAIVRTVAEGRDAKSLDTDLKLLVERWNRIEKRMAQGPSSPALVHEDVDMASSIIRDQFSSDYDRILVDNKSLYHSVKSYVRAVAPKMASSVELHQGNEPVFKAANIQSGADKAFRDRIELPSGGYLYIEQTEAMHVVDVNSGRSGRGMSQEENSLKVNLEAARVISHQIRLRDLGGIIVIDFIDLRGSKNRKKVHEELKKGFKDDRAVTKILPMSDFGLVEITRQRLRPSITTTFSSSNGSRGGDGPPASDERTKELSNQVKQQQAEVQRLRNEVQRWKREAQSEDSPPEEVRTLKQEVSRLKRELDEATQAAEQAAADARNAEREAQQHEATRDEAPKAEAAAIQPPAAFVDSIEQWIQNYAADGNRRAVTLRVHPFTAAFLSRPVPSYPTRWFMNHLVRVHIEADESLSPLAYRFVNPRTGQTLQQHTAAAA